MNLDLIIKLVKLANNNPNENESNLAARKVCKLIAEGNFQFNGIKEPVTRKGGTWNDVKRSTEPQWSSKPPTGSGFDIFEEFFKRAGRYRTTKEQEEFYRAGGWANPINEKPKQNKEKRPLECTECHTMVDTAFVGVPQTFVCNACIWKVWAEKNTKL